MTALTIILLILAGIVLLFLEFFVIPGVTIAGIGGFVLLAVGVFIAYSKYSAFYGHLTLVITFFALLAFFLYTLRSKTWTKISLNTEINSKVNEIQVDLIKEGDKGLAVSRLAPMGTIFINDMYVEAETRNDFIDQNTEIEIIKVLPNRVIVKKSDYIKS
jgi:membrane-bound ClpP family serine protease